MSMNSVNISGHIGREPEIRATQGGTQVLSFSVAVNERVKNQHTGQYEDRPNWVDVTVFGNYAESMARILEKGMKVAVSGRLRQSTWEKDGQKRSKLEVIASNIDLMSKSDGGGAQQQADQQYRQQAPAAPGGTQPFSLAQAAQAPAYQQQTAPVVDVYDEAIPF